MSTPVRVGGGADYLYSEAWTLGTASKIYTEHNLFEIDGSRDAPRLIGFSSSRPDAALQKTGGIEAGSDRQGGCGTDVIGINAKIKSPECPGLFLVSMAIPI